MLEIFYAICTCFLTILMVLCTAKLLYLSIYKCLLRGHDWETIDHKTIKVTTVKPSTGSLVDENKYELYVQRCKRCGTIKETKIWY